MCLAVPGRVITITDEGGFRKGRVSFSGVERDIDLLFVPEVELGDYVIVHVGFAIARLDILAAERSLNLYKEIENGSRIQGEKNP